MKNIKFLAYYLPQYHPIPENDKWWGKGFTEWTNVVKAKPLFKGHIQPILPGELGFYDLRIPEVRQAQSSLAKQYGIDGFIYYQYWFDNGKMLLEQPAEAMLKDRSTTIPFCFCWANETWKGIWHGINNPEVLIEQKYNGKLGYIEYFKYLLPFFKDGRYIKIENKPMFHILRIEDIPDVDVFIETFNNLAVQAGFDGIYFISTIVSDLNFSLKYEKIYGQIGNDVFLKMRYKQINKFEGIRYLGKIERKIKAFLGYTLSLEKRKKPLILDYKKGVENLNINYPHKKYIPCVFPNWDNSARSGNKSMIFKNANPTAWQEHLQFAVNKQIKAFQNPPFIIIKSWNEWAEGNYLEPDSMYGRKWLEAVKRVKDKL
ncbi:lipopolysaccharide biosynthesis protein [Lutibacter sp. B1]|nr:lipopolysaccharide biosynthesis protein [Lutibacter sp. B1]